jgi:SSS family solute:Na+ symporter
VSLATPPTEPIRLAPFFPEVENKIFGGQSLHVDKNSAIYRDVTAKINQKISGDRAHLNLSIDLQPVRSNGAYISDELDWDNYVERLKSVHTRWYTPTGRHIVYRFSQADMLACIKMVRGDLHQIWLSAEPKVAQIDRLKDELFISYEEIEDALIEFGLSASPSRS